MSHNCQRNNPHPSSAGLLVSLTPRVRQNVVGWYRCFGEGRGARREREREREFPEEWGRFPAISGI